jgi:hypothetical protein
MDKFQGLSKEQQEGIVKIALVAAAIGPVILIIGKVITIIGSLTSAISTVSAFMATAGGMAGVLGTAFTALTGPVGIAIAIIGGLIAVGVILYKNWDVIKEKAGALGASLGEKWSEIKNKTTQTWNGVGTAIINPINKARDGVCNAINTILGFFKNIKIPEIKIPKIKLPHFNMSGNFSISPPSVPHLDVNWYAKGGIFNKPSVIGIGEAGTEAVVPIDRLDDIIAKSLEKVSNKNNTSIYFNGNYSFAEKKDIDYFMNKAALLVQRRKV